MDKGPKKFIICFFVLLLFLLSLPQKGRGSNLIKIALLTSPPPAEFSSNKPFIWGAEMAVAEINSLEEKTGIQFLLYLRDGFLGGEKDIGELRQVVEKEEIKFLIGSISAESILPIAYLANEKRIPFLVSPIRFMEVASSSADPENLFWICPSPEAFQRAAVRQVAKFPQKRIFFLAQDLKISRSWAKYFWEELLKLKPDKKPAGEIFLPKKMEDFGEYIKMILAAKSEICMSHLSIQEWIRFVPQAKKQGYFKKIIHFELESGSLDNLVALGKELPEGIWGVSAFPFWGLDNEKTKNFVHKYHQKTRSFPGLPTLSGYVSIYALLAAIKKGGSVDPDKILKSLPGLSFSTPMGPLTIRSSDRRALWPIWCGVSKFSSNYPFPILENLIFFGPDSFQP